MKKLWDNPELTVLVRRKSDEAILHVCKGSGNGANTKHTGCYEGNCNSACNS